MKLFEYDKQILKSSHKIKTTLEIINIESGSNMKKCGIQSLNVEGKNIGNQQIVPEVFIMYFTTIVKNTN
jgi:hypothetical protein